MRSNLVYAAPVVDKPLRISGRGDATVKPSAMLDNTTSLTTGNSRAASGAGTSLTARRNKVTGLGPTPHIAQNGIQLSFGAGGTIENNVVANHVRTGCTAIACPYVSTNVLVYQAADGAAVRGNDGSGNTVRRNTVNEAPIGVWSFSGTNTISTTGFQMNHFLNVAVDVHTGMTPPLAPKLRFLAAPRTARVAAPSPVP